MIKYDHQEKAISLHHFRHLWQIYWGVSWALLTTLIMTKRNLHLAPGNWELKELKVFSNIFGELWTFIGTCAIVRGLIWPLLSSHANLNLQLRCANWKSSVLKPAAHSILTPLVSLQVSTRRPKSTKVTCAHCSKYDSKISQHFGSLVSDTLQGLSRNFFWCRHKHYVLVTSQFTTSSNESMLFYIPFMFFAARVHHAQAFFQHLLSSTRLKVAIRCPWFSMMMFSTLFSL